MLKKKLFFKKIEYYLRTRNFIPGYNSFHYLISLILKPLISKKFFLIISLKKKNSYKQDSINYKNYQDYLEWQQAGFNLKQNSVWVSEKNIKKICDNLKLTKKVSLLCLGTRNGKEQLLFKKYLPKNSFVLGFEVSNKAKNYPNTIRWDFNFLNQKYINKFDFVYSNSHDHLFKKKNILKWFKYLKSNGILFLDQSEAHGKLYSDKMDPTSFETELLPYEILDISKNTIYPYKMITTYDQPDSMRRKIFYFKKN